jgi:hypothetical protein
MVTIVVSRIGTPKIRTGAAMTATRLRDPPGAGASASPAGGGKVLYWSDFRDAFQILRDVSPYKVLFYEMESVHQIALNVAARSLGITTYYIDHGWRGLSEASVHEQAWEAARKQRTVIGLAQKALRQGLRRTARNWRFVKRTANALEAGDRRFLLEYRRTRYAHNILDTHRRVQADQIYPTEYVSFSPKNFEFHRGLHPRVGRPVHYIGIPEFDPIAHAASTNRRNREVLLIEQAHTRYSEHCGWTVPLRVRFLADLAARVARTGHQLHVKRHPVESPEVWAALTDAPVTWVPDQAFYARLTSYPVVLGYWSTLMMPLAARRHTAMFCFRDHPNSSFKPPAFLVDAGVADWLGGPEELADYLDSSKRLAAVWERQDDHRDRFVRDWLYRFDGRSEERLLEIIAS